MSREKAVVFSVVLLAAMGAALLVCLLGVFWALEESPTLAPGGPGGSQPPTAAVTGGGPGANSGGVREHPPGGPAARPAPGTDGDLATSLDITTEPAGATVLIDGRIIGVSPVKGVEVAAGPHSLRLEKEGYEPKIEAVQFHTGSTEFSAKLTAVAYAQLTVKSLPAGAEVAIDGEFRGRTPLTLLHVRPGPHELRVAKANFSTYQSVVILKPGEQAVVKDLKLENKLQSMLEALLEQEPRAIGNWMELAHFHYVNNDMAAAARYFVRARELAAQPMPKPNPDMTEGEREALLNEAQWDRTKLIGEIRKHLEQGRTYYGSELDYDAFKSAYAASDREFATWQNNWRDLKWVENEAFARGLNGDWERVQTLFTDYVVAVDATSGAGWAGVVKAELLAGKLAAAEEHYPHAIETLNKPATGVEQRYREIAWLDMAKAFATAAWRMPAGERKQLLARMQACLQALEDLPGKSPLTRLEAVRAQGQYYRLAGDPPARLKFLTSAAAAAADELQKMAANASNRRFVREESERIRLQLAWAELAAGQPAAARKRVEGLRGADTQAADVTVDAAAMLDQFAKGLTPVEPGLEPVVTAPSGGEPKARER